MVMGPPSNLKPPRKNSLPPSSNWKGKARSRKQTRKRNPNPTLNPNPNPNSNRRKQHAGNIVWMQDQRQVYQPPRLQDLQFQNRLKAFRHFDDRQDTAAIVYNSSRSLMVDASGFGTPTFNTSRAFVADTHAGGMAQGGLDFPAQGSGFSGSLAYPRKGKANISSFPVSNPRLLNTRGKGVMAPVAMHYTREFDGSLLSGLSLASNSRGTLNIAAAQPALFNYAVKGDASTSGSASAVLKASVKGNTSFKRNRAFRRSRRAIVGARKQIGAPAAPRNTTSFLMRAKKSGGIASFVSPSPVTPAVIPTPIISPSVQLAGLANEANHEWGVNDYGSMNGLIRLRSLDFGLGLGDNNDSESEVEQGVESVQQLEQRLDHDVSRFVMTYPTSRPKDMGQNLMETNVDDQDCHIAHLEEENMDLKERLYSMQQEVEDLRRRMRVLEGASSGDDVEAEASPERSVADMSSV